MEEEPTFEPIQRIDPESLLARPNLENLIVKPEVRIINLYEIEKKLANAGFSRDLDRHGFALKRNK
ncbi:MAG: hypothetical protein ACTSUE_06515 [Promethearchaeota archaeon]